MDRYEFYSVVAILAAIVVTRISFHWSRAFRVARMAEAGFDPYPCNCAQSGSDDDTTEPVRATAADIRK